ncbi:helix-turn-helix transcriptional regulator [Paenibacillus sp. strain BS8-2]
MNCLELTIPPLPQLTTVGHAYWSPGQQHLERTFEVYDLLFVNQGTLYMTEDGIAYDINAGQFLILEPGRHHIGHRPCDETTDIYWVHFVHDAPVRTMDSSSIPWTFSYVRGTDKDLTPQPQVMYLPKHADFHQPDIVPILDRMVELHRQPIASNSLPLQAELAELLVRLQQAAQTRYTSRSRRLCDAAIDYLQQHMTEPFDAKHMEGSLHYRFDYIARCLKKHTGMSPLQYMHDLRIRMALTLLENAELTVGEVGERLGFDSANYFIRLFRKETGMTPGQYRSVRLGRA